MVSHAKKLTISNLSLTTVEIPNHPVNDMGKRKIEIIQAFSFLEKMPRQLVKEWRSGF